MIGEAADLGFRTVVLDVDAANDGAIRLYHRLGFLITVERNGARGTDAPSLASVRMELPLPTG